jgi:hypothetical protein
MSRQRSVWTFRQVLAVIFCWRRWSGWAVAGVVRPAEESGERRVASCACASVRSARSCASAIAAAGVLAACDG